MYAPWFFARTDTADPCNGRAYDNGRRTDQKEGDLNGKGKGENEQNEDTDEQDPRERTAEKAVFFMRTRGDISAQKCRYEKRDEGENGSEPFGVLHGKPRKAGDDEKQKSDDERKERSEKDGNEKAFFFSRLRAIFDG